MIATILIPLGTAALGGWACYAHLKRIEGAGGETSGLSAPDAPQGAELKALAAQDKAKAYTIIFESALAAVKDEGKDGEDALNAAAMVTAHAALETGGFKYFVDRNLFGVNAVGDEPFVTADDHGHSRHFRTYDSFVESVGAYVSLVHRRYTAAWAAIDQRDTASYAAGLKHRDSDGAAYYEAPEADFAAALKSQYNYLAGIL